MIAINPGDQSTGLILPCFGLCLIFVFQLSFAKEQVAKAQQIIALVKDLPDVSYAEVSLGRQEVLGGRWQLFDPLPTTLGDLKSALLRVSLDFGELFDDTRQAAAAGGGMIAHRLVRTPGENWLNCTVDITQDAFLNDAHCLIIVESLPAEQQARFERIGGFEGLHVAMSALRVRQFHVVNGEIVMDTEQLGNELQRGDVRALKTFFEPKDLGKYEALLRRRKATFRLQAKSGDLWYSAVSNGESGFVFCIDDLAQSRHQVHFDDERQQLAAASAVVLCWAVDPATDKVRSLFMQPTVWDTLSVDSDTPFRRFVDYVEPDDRETFRRNYAQIVGKDIEQWTGEIRIIRMGGTYEWHRIIVARSRDSLLHCLALNIHKQQEMEGRLNETRKLRDLLLSSGKLALWCFNDDRQILDRLERFEPGLMTVVVMNWHFIDTQVHPAYREAFRSHIEQAFKVEGASVAIDVPLLLDSEIWFAVRGKLRQESRQIVGVCIDITELRAAYTELETQKRRADEASRQKTMFLANMSHEIRTPMNGIFGILDILATQELTSEQRLIVDTIRASSFRLMGLLEDTLTLTKIEQGEVESNPSVFNLSKLFEPVCVAAASRAKSNGIRFLVQIPADFPILVFGDSQLLMQVINNLISNALKFTKAGSITVKMTLDQCEQLTFDVPDTGIGMTREQQKIIFNLFIQPDPSITRFFGGSGLGLALVQEIVTFLGGRLSLQSAVGAGSTFTCVVPMRAVMVPYSAPFSDGREHVIATLVCDEMIADTVKKVGEAQHYVMVSCVHPEDLMGICQARRVDLVVVEGDCSVWPQVKHVVARIPVERAPKVCSLANAGEAGFFRCSITKPILPENFISFLNSVRYNEKALQSEAQDVTQGEQSSKILVVEDNKTNEFVMKKILQNIGCTFEIAENGREAIETLERSQFDLVFMDCQMPVLDGLEATRIIRRCGKQYSSIPIVALTASAVEGDEQTCRDAGMDDYLAKPVRIPQIKGAINKFRH
jgi:signal transduction histidine kinase/CheY-like chemotaxis protein